MGYKLLKMQEIQEAVQQEFATRQNRTHITGDQVVEELAKIALFKVEDYYRDYGMEIRLTDKIKALELLGKHLGTFTEKISISGITPEMVAEVEALVNDAATGD